jgi:hypothetical protein
MKREEEIWLSCKDECVDALAADTRAFHESLEADAAVSKDFLRHFAELFRILIAAQEAGTKGPLRYITICFPKSSAVAETYELVTACHGVDLYTDETETETYWRMDFLREMTDRGTADIVPRLKRKIVRIRDREIEEFRIQYAHTYTALLLTFFDRILPSIFELPEFRAVRKESLVDVSFGGYMEEAPVLIAYGKEGAQ